ncbi:hypothetical protein XHV734_0695 [Xanthomonas hortorum pv. vitians]|nr:hypothetical protein XHV734_0695 [Xanthomonas hortorum pv. vitians]
MTTASTARGKNPTERVRAKDCAAWAAFKGWGQKNFDDLSNTGAELEPGSTDCHAQALESGSHSPITRSCR